MSKNCCYSEDTRATLLVAEDRSDMRRQRREGAKGEVRLTVYLGCLLEDTDKSHELQEACTYPNYRRGFKLTKHTHTISQNLKTNILRDIAR